MRYLNNQVCAEGGDSRASFSPASNSDPFRFRMWCGDSASRALRAWGELELPDQTRKLAALIGSCRSPQNKRTNVGRCVISAGDSCTPINRAIYIHTEMSAVGSHNECAANSLSFAPAESEEEHPRRFSFLWGFKKLCVRSGKPQNPDLKFGTKKKTLDKTVEKEKLSPVGTKRLKTSRRQSNAIQREITTHSLINRGMQLKADVKSWITRVQRVNTYGSGGK